MLISCISKFFLDHTSVDEAGNMLRLHCFVLDHTFAEASNMLRLKLMLSICTLVHLRDDTNEMAQITV